MASSHVPTGTLTNLSRLELEALRKADAASQGRAVTKGDDGTVTGGVGVGSVIREPFKSGPSIHLDDVYALTPPVAPGAGLGTTTQVSFIPSETVQWFGPTYITDGTSATLGAATLTDTTIALDFAAAGVLAGDFVLIKPSAEASGIGPNAYAVATVQTTPLAGATSLALNNILTTTGATSLTAAAKVYSYVIVRKTASRLFAMPGSGTVGEEQAFLFVRPDSTLHTQANPSLTAIETDRITNIVPATFNGATTDRADAVFAATRGTLDKVGYRVILYPDNGSGAPDFTKPILSSTPKINTAYATGEQRLTIDHRAGIVRLSMAPNAGSDINPAGVYSTQGRVNLWAIFWSFDQSITQATSRGLFNQRSTETKAVIPARVRWDATRNVWLAGSTNDVNHFYIKALATEDDYRIGTEFGTYDLFGGLPFSRYFRYERSKNVWRMKASENLLDSDKLGPSQYESVELGGRTKLTVGDGSAPSLSRGDYNPTEHLDGTTTTKLGFRKTDSAIKTALTKTVDGSYTTVHLRKGRYYSEETIFVPPGVIIEGEGPATRIISRAPSGSVTHEPIFHVGPNTPWGVWDASSVEAVVSPTQFDFATNQKLEGYDVVWNPTRRVWGVVHADCTNNAIWFNEIKADGTTVLTGLGIDIKNDARILYSSAQPGSSHHTPAHYPRIAYHEAQDEYAVVWVEKDPAANGPQCKLQIVETITNPSLTDSDYPVTFSTRFVTTAQAKMVGSGNFNDHPSVAVDNSDPDVGYAVAVSYWNFGPILTPTEMWCSVYNSNTLANVLVDSEVLTIRHVVSSTDVVEDGQGGFLWAWSERNHPLYRGTNGAVTVGVLTDATFGNFATQGVEKGDRFLYLGGTGLIGGVDGVITAVSGASVTPTMDDGAAAIDTGVNVLTWAIVPTSKVFSRRLYAGAGTVGSVIPVVTHDSASTDYRIDQREPDFVRISHGNGNFLVVYQAFDTTAWMSRTEIANFDSGVDTGYEDANGLTLEDLNAYRAHLSTCAVLLNLNGEPMLPGVDVDAVGPEHQARPHVITMRSLGAREPLVASPAAPAAASVGDYHRWISARNFMHKWTTSKTPSLIPDVTWTGDDWVVVSPSLNEIRSTTGMLNVSGGAPYYFMDGTFYFGGDSLDALSKTYLRKTVETGDQIVIASLSLVLEVVAHVSEHVVEVAVVDGVLPGTDQTKLEWSLVRSDEVSTAGGVSGGIKNPGFRVAADGRLILGTSYTTFADAPEENLSGLVPRRTETLLRKNADGLNNPASLSTFGGMNAPQFSQSAIWTDVSFRGVAVGAPKGSASNNSVLGESPCVAIAWGETMYGFLDREVIGRDSGTVNRTNFFRQTFGPYRVGFRNLSLTSGNFQSLTSPTLKVLSQEHVLTRHGAPGTATGGFATDGYRNCFVSPVQNNSQGISKAERYFSGNLIGYYTTAIGAHPVAVDGPENISLSEYHLAGRYIDDVVLDQPAATNAPADTVLTNSKPSSPIVIWDGQRFVAAWTEANISGTTSTFTRYGLICLGALPGGEDSSTFDRLLTGDSELKNEVIEFATVSVGNRTTDAFTRTMFAADLAHSGRTYAVIWTAGQNTSTGDLGGSAIGVTIFNGTGKKSSGQTFVIATHANRGQYQDAKIIWDGKQYVAIWRQQNTGTGFGEVMGLVIPEDGFGGNSQIAYASSNWSGSGPNYIRRLGNVVTAGVPPNPPAGQEAAINVLGQAIQAKPGDVVHIDHILITGVTADRRYSGWWMVRDYDPVTGLLHLHYDTEGGTYDVPFAGLTAGTHHVIGAVISMSAGATAALQTEKDGGTYRPRGAMTGPVSEPVQLVTQTWSTIGKISDDPDRIDALVYNEAEDEYAALIRKSGSLSMLTWKRGTYKPGPERVLASLGGNIRCASLGWNGQNYLVTYANFTTNDIRWMLLDSRLGEIGHGFVQTGSGLIGNGVDQLPGPGYGAIDATSLIQPRVRNLTTRWNDRLNRWVLSASVLWYHERSVTAANSHIEAPVMFPTTASLAKIEFGISSGRTLTTTAGPTNWAQVGMRIVGVRDDGSNFQYHNAATVKNVGGGGFLTIDTDKVTNWDALTQAHYGIVGGADEMVIGIMVREDIVCWTLGAESPAVKLLDADDVFFENVEFSGGAVDVEERYRWMARPMWQNAGPAFGNPSAGLFLHQAGRTLLTPYKKARPVVLNNVRSTTALGRHKK